VVEEGVLLNATLTMNRGGRPGEPPVKK